MEMERRGYSVAFTANYDFQDTNRYNPKVVISPAIYRDGQLITDLEKYGLKKKVANLLWEQLIGVKQEEMPHGAHNIIGTGQKVVTFCWGKRTQDRLASDGMPRDKAIVVGQINTDLLRGSFKDTLLDKVTIAKQFKINENARWNLFISSFSYCELDELQKKGISAAVGQKHLEDFTRISIESRKALLSWFEEVLQRYTDDIIIYRPHPDEARKSVVLKDLEKKYNNFRVIGDLALKHWINSSDKVYNWFSTGIIDGLVLDKPIRIVRPCPIPIEYDYRLFHSAKHIKSMDEFKEDYSSLEKEEVFDPDMLSEYYYIPNGFVYQEICDVLEDMLKSDKYDIHYSLKERLYFGSKRCIYLLSNNLSFIKPLLRKLNLFKDTFAKSDIARKALEAGYAKNVATDEEINELYSRLKPIVYGEQI